MFGAWVWLVVSNLELVGIDEGRVAAPIFGVPAQNTMIGKRLDFTGDTLNGADAGVGVHHVTGIWLQVIGYHDLARWYGNGNGDGCIGHG